VKLLERWKGWFYSGLILVLGGLIVPLTGLILFLIDSSYLDGMFFDYISRYLFGGLPLLIWGIVQMYTSYKNRGKVTYFAHGIMFINKKTLQSLLNEKIVEGKGTYMEPFYIVKRDYKIGRIQIRDIKDFFLIEGMSIPILTVLRCKYLTIDYNIFHAVKIRESQNLTLKNNTIQELRLINAYFELRENNDIAKLREVFP